MTCSHLPSPPSQLTPGQLGGADAEEEVKKNFMLAFEGIIDFPDLVYIGAVVRCWVHGIIMESSLSLTGAYCTGVGGGVYVYLADVCIWPMCVAGRCV